MQHESGNIRLIKIHEKINKKKIEAEKLKDLFVEKGIQMLNELLY